MRLPLALPAWQRVTATAALAMLLSAYALSVANTGVVIFFLAVTALVVAGALVGLPIGGMAIGSMAGAYGAALLASNTELDSGAPLFGVGLFLLAELLYKEKVIPETTSPEASRDRTWTILLFSLGGFIFASVVLALGSAVALSGPIALAAAGLLAALLLGSVVVAATSLLAPGPSPRQDR